MRWDARSGRPLGTPKAITSALTSSPALVGFIARGTRLVTSSAADNQTVIRDATTLLPVRRLRGGGAAASVTADGHVAALGGPQGSVRLLDLRSGAMRVLGGRQTGPVAAMQFTPDSRTLLTAGQDARFTVWDVEHASAVRTFAGAPGSVSQLAIAPDGRTAYSAGVDGSLIGFDLTRARWLGRPFRVGPAHPTGVLALTAKGSGFAVPKDDRSVDLLDTRSLTRARRISFGRAPSGARQPLLVAAAPDGRTLAAGTPAGQVGFADPGTGQLLGAPQEAHVGPVSALAFSHDGRWLVTAGEDRALYVWDARRRKIASHFVDLTLPATSLSVNPSDTELAATVVRDNGSGELDILAIPRLALLAQVSEPRGVQTRFSSNGRLLFYADDTGRVWTLDTRDWEPLGQPLVGQAKPGPFALSPDERILATTSANGTTQLWDTASRLPIGSPLPGVARDPVSAAFVDGGTHLVTLQSNGNGFVWDVQPQSWARRACAVAGRELTRKEWQDALPGRDYAPACVRR
jgi:WD40 repeat protein